MLGATIARMDRRPLADRFWEKVTKRGPDECWEWTAGRVKGGYGRINRGGKGGRLLLAHRVAYELEHGPICDEDLEGKRVCVLHRCDNPPCVNPAHLWLGTDADNTADMDAKGRRANIKGERHHQAKVTEAIVQAIRTKYTGRRGEINALSREFSMSASQIGNIVHRRHWGHVA